MAPASELPSPQWQRRARIHQIGRQQRRAQAAAAQRRQRRTTALQGAGRRRGAATGEVRSGWRKILGQGALMGKIMGK